MAAPVQKRTPLYVDVREPAGRGVAPGRRGQVPKVVALGNGALTALRDPGGSDVGGSGRCQHTGAARSRSQHRPQHRPQHAAQPTCAIPAAVKRTIRCIAVWIETSPASVTLAKHTALGDTACAPIWTQQSAESAQNQRESAQNQRDIDQATRDIATAQTQHIVTAQTQRTVTAHTQRTVTAQTQRRHSHHQSA